MSVMLRAIATSNPPLYVTQEEAYDFYVSHFPMTPDEQSLYQRILIDGPIRGRYIGMRRKEDACETDPDVLNARHLKYGRMIASEAARRALDKAGRTAKQVTGLVVNTCTGYLCPGFSSYVIEELGLPDSTKTFDIAGMGCGGALPNLECASGLIKPGSDGVVLSIAVEICTATIFMGDDPGLIVSNSIFGDGAAAGVLSSENGTPSSGTCRILDFESGIFPKDRNHLQYRYEGGRLRNVLTRRVPILGARHVQAVLKRLLSRHNLDVASIPWWAIHAGGTAVLDRVGETLGLEPEQLRFSNAVFQEFGNMSSPTVLFALTKLIDEGCPKPGEKGVLLAFGAGFSAFACLVEF